MAHFWGTKISAGKFREVEVPAGACLRVCNVVAAAGSSGVLTLFVRTEDINDDTCVCALAVLRPGGGCDNVQINSAFCEDIPLRFSVRASEGGSGAVYVSGFYEEAGDDEDDEADGYAGYGDEEDDDYMNGGDDDEDDDEEDELDDDDDEGGMLSALQDGDEYDDEDEDDLPGADDAKPGMSAGKKRSASYDIDRDQVDDDDDDDDEIDDITDEPSQKRARDG